jgi:hypothetical protein
LLPIPGLCPCAVGLPSTVAIFVVAGRVAWQPGEAHTFFPPGSATLSNFLASPEAAPLAETIKMIRMHAHGTLRPVIPACTNTSSMCDGGRKAKLLAVAVYLLSSLSSFGSVCWVSFERQSLQQFIGTESVCHVPMCLFVQPPYVHGAKK